MCQIAKQNTEKLTALVQVGNRVPLLPINDDHKDYLDDYRQH